MSHKAAERMIRKPGHILFQSVFPFSYLCRPFPFYSSFCCQSRNNEGLFDWNHCETLSWRIAFYEPRTWYFYPITLVQIQLHKTVLRGNLFLFLNVSIYWFRRSNNRVQNVLIISESMLRYIIYCCWYQHWQVHF